MVVIVSEIRHRSFTQCYIIAPVKLHIKHPRWLVGRNSISQCRLELRAKLGVQSVTHEVCDTLLSTLTCRLYFVEEKCESGR